MITNGVIKLGVDDFGQLNVSDPTSFDIIGVTHVPSDLEATSPGCLCEGWGVGVADAGGVAIASGSANKDDGVFGLDLVSFTSTASTATSVTELPGYLRITHSFGPAAETADLYRVKVELENISGTDIADLRYTRTFDWDVEPTAFTEFVTIQGTATTAALLYSNNNGFEFSDPFAGRSILDDGIAATDEEGDFVDLGATVLDLDGVLDQGTNFDFGFGGLAAGKTFSFDIFYGASVDEAATLLALGEVGAELFSLGQSTIYDNSGLPGPNNDGVTFAFGFSGVGGAIIIPDPTPDDPNPVPLPASVWLLLSGFAALVGRRALRRAA